MDIIGGLGLLFLEILGFAFLRFWGVCLWFSYRDGPIRGPEPLEEHEFTRAILKPILCSTREGLENGFGHRPCSTTEGLEPVILLLRSTKMSHFSTT